MSRVRFYIRCPWCGARRSSEWLQVHLEKSHPDVWAWIEGLAMNRTALEGARSFKSAMRAVGLVLVVFLIAACTSAQSAPRTAAEVHDSLVWERDFTIDLRRQSTGRIRRLDSIYARIDARRVEKLTILDSLLRLPR